MTQGDFILKSRKRLKISRLALARRLLCSANYLREVEAGRTTLAADGQIIARLSDVLGVSTDYVQALAPRTVLQRVAALEEQVARLETHIAQAVRNAPQFFD